MKGKVLALTLLTVFWTDAIADNGYLCVADLVTGFYFDEDLESWQQANFLPGERFTIEERREDVYQVERVDDPVSWSAVCAVKRDQSDDSFSCMSGTSQFHFNREELRFTAFRYYGYWNGSKDSVAISIGKCFPN